MGLVLDPVMEEAISRPEFKDDMKTESSSEAADALVTTACSL